MDAFVHCECHESEAPSYFYLPENFYLLETRIDVNEVKASSFVTLFERAKSTELGLVCQDCCKYFSKSLPSHEFYY
jgi:hypothetical protein